LRGNRLEVHNSEGQFRVNLAMWICAYMHVRCTGANVCNSLTTFLNFVECNLHLGMKDITELLSEISSYLRHGSLPKQESCSLVFTSHTAETCQDVINAPSSEQDFRLKKQTT